MHGHLGLERTKQELRGCMGLLGPQSWHLYAMKAPQDLRSERVCPNGMSKSQQPLYLDQNMK